MFLHAKHMPQKKKPTKGEAAAIKTTVSTSSGRSRRMTGKDSAAFLAEVKLSLSPENYTKFLDAMKGVKTTHTKGDITYERGMNILDGFPALCSTFELFFSEVLAKNTRVGKALAIVPASSPMKCFFNRDYFNVIVPLVPYLSMGYLIQTCKWARGNITNEQIKGCKDRAKLIIGRAVPVSDQRFGVLFKIYNLKEEAVEVGLYHKQSTVMVCRFKSKIFIGGVSGAALDLLKRLASSYESGDAGAVSTKVQFDYRSTFENESAKLHLKMHDNSMGVWWVQCVVMHPLL